MLFEILCLDTKEQVKSKTVKTLLYSLMANDTLFENPIMEEERGEIKDDSLKLQLHIKQFPTDQMLTGVRYSAAFTIAISCDDLAKIDTFRIDFVDYIKTIGFSNVRILLDETSATLAASLYTKLYSLENKVRTFVINFFLKNLGTNWAKLTMPPETLKKINERRDNDRIFISNNRIDSDVALIDFDDLGRILYSENSILSSKRADNVALLIEKISKATDLKSLKAEVLEGNFYKYFKDCFTQKDFEKKWYDLYYYRNKVAHNGSFTKEETNTCINLCDSISYIIDKAYEKLDTFKLSTSDQEALMAAVNELASASSQSNFSNDKSFKTITKDILLKELKESQNKLPFVSLRHFVMEFLGKKGYDYEASYTLINYLEDKGVIKLTKVDNPYGDYQTTTISIA